MGLLRVLERTDCGWGHVDNNTLNSSPESAGRPQVAQAVERKGPVCANDKRVYDAAGVGGRVY